MNAVTVSTNNDQQSLIALVPDHEGTILRVWSKHPEMLDMARDLAREIAGFDLSSTPDCWMEQFPTYRLMCESGWSERIMAIVTDAAIVIRDMEKSKDEVDSPNAYQQAQVLLQADKFDYWAAIKLLREEGIIEASAKNPKKDAAREMLLLIQDEFAETEDISDRELTQEQKDFFVGITTFGDLMYSPTGYVDSVGNPIFLFPHIKNTDEVAIFDRESGNLLKTMPRAVFEANKHLLLSDEKWQEQHQDSPAKKAKKEKTPRQPKTINIAPASTTIKKQVKSPTIKPGSKLELEIATLRKGATKQEILDALGWKSWSHSRSDALRYGYGIRRDLEGKYWLVDGDEDIEF